MRDESYKSFVSSIIYNSDGSYKSPSPYDDLPAKMAMVGDYMRQLHDDKEWRMLHDGMQWLSEAKVVLHMTDLPNG